MSQILDFRANARPHAYRWAIIGFGHVAGIHAHAMYQNQDVLAGFSTSNVAVQSGDASGLVFNIGDVPGPRFATEGMIITDRDYRNILADSTIEGVIVCAPTQFHRKIAMDVCEANKDCLMEKPMGMTSAECGAMIRRFKKKKRKIVVAHVLPSFPQYALLRKLLAEKLPLLTCLTMTRLVSDKRLNDQSDTLARGGFAKDLGVHDLNLVLGLSEAQSATVDLGSVISVYDQPQFVSVLLHLRDTLGKCVLNVGVTRNDNYGYFFHGYEARFSDGDSLVFNGNEVIRDGSEVVPLAPKTPIDFFAEEQLIARDHFQMGADPQYLCPKAAKKALYVWEKIERSIKSGEYEPLND